MPDEGPMLFISAATPAQLTWTTIFLVLGAVAAVVFAIWAVGRFIPEAKKYRNAGGNALMRADVFFRPSREHILEAKEHDATQDESSGDRPSF